MLEAIGEPEVIETKLDERLSRIYSNKIIKRYPAFQEFFGMEDTIEQIVSFFKHAAQGLEEKKQILYLLGPVGGGKSSLAERLKQLMEKSSIYVLVAGDEVSPVFENPLGLFANYRDELESEYGIPKRYAPSCASPWATKRLSEFEGDNVIRVFNSSVCNGCYNRFRLDAGDWNWCPDQKGTDRQFECTKSITGKMVIDAIKSKGWVKELETQDYIL